MTNKMRFAMLVLVLILTLILIAYPRAVAVDAAGADLLGPPAFTMTVNILPWDFDRHFLSCQRQSGTHVLLAAYCAVLKDPLPGEEYNVHLAAAMLAGIVIPPGTTFSQNTALGPYTEERGFKEGPTYSGTELIKTIGGGVCKIASTLYNVAILSNLEIVERHCHSMPVPYVPYGQDATVSCGSKDFRFRNNTSDPVMIWAEGLENRLYIAFYGYSTPPRITWEHEVLSTVKAPTLYRLNNSLAQGDQRLVLEGMDGACVRSRIHIHYNDGSRELMDLGTSRYNPMPYIMETGGG